MASPQQPIPLTYAEPPPRSGKRLFLSIIGVIVGYLAMGVTIFATFSAAYLAMGADRAFQPGTYDPSALWLLVSFALGIAAAITGGILCRLIATTMTAVYVLAAIAFALGLMMAVGVLLADPAEVGPRTGDVPNMEAMTKAQTPIGVAFINPFIGAAGIVAGGLVIDKRRRG